MGNSGENKTKNKKNNNKSEGDREAEKKDGGRKYRRGESKLTRRKRTEKY
jgi:hypothetical protein